MSNSIKKIWKWQVKRSGVCHIRYLTPLFSCCLVMSILPSLSVFSTIYNVFLSHLLYLYKTKTKKPNRINLILNILRSNTMRSLTIFLSLRKCPFTPPKRKRKHQLTDYLTDYMALVDNSLPELNSYKSDYTEKPFWTFDLLLSGPL